MKLNFIATSDTEQQISICSKMRWQACIHKTRKNLPQDYVGHGL